MPPFTPLTLVSHNSPPYFTRRPLRGALARGTPITKDWNKQRGFALGYALAALFILAAIVAVIAIAGQSVNTTGTADQFSKAMASTIIQQGNNIKSGVDKVSINGYTIDQVFFNGVPNYTDLVPTVTSVGGSLYGATCALPAGTGTAGAAPTAADCALLNVATDTTAAYMDAEVLANTGGGVSAPLPPSEALIDMTQHFLYSIWVLGNGSSYLGTGGTATGSNGSLVVYLPHLKTAVCEQINVIINGAQSTSLPPTSTTAAIPTGGATLSAFDTTGSSSIPPRPEGCLSVGGTYVYYKALAIE